MSGVTTSIIPRTRLLKVSIVTTTIKGATIDVVTIILQEDTETDTVAVMIFITTLALQIHS